MINGRKRPSWEEYALILAKTAALRSEDLFVRVGACCLRHDHSVISLGYNGAVSGISIDWTNRDERRKRVIHAEANALNRILPNEASLMAVTHLCCSECIKLVAQKNIKKVIYELELSNYDNDLTQLLAKEFGIELVQMSVNNIKNLLE